MNGSGSAKKGSNGESRARYCNESKKGIKVGVKMRNRVAKNVYKKDVVRQTETRGR